MTREQLWKIYSAKNPSFEGEGNVTMSARGLRKLFNTTWDVALGNATIRGHNDDLKNNRVEALKRVFGMF
jgi:hypothetical protein